MLLLFFLSYVLPVYSKREENGEEAQKKVEVFNSLVPITLALPYVTIKHTWIVCSPLYWSLHSFIVFVMKVLFYLNKISTHYLKLHILFYRRSEKKYHRYMHTTIFHLKYTSKCFQFSKRLNVCICRWFCMYFCPGFSMFIFNLTNFMQRTSYAISVWKQSSERASRGSKNHTKTPSLFRYRRKREKKKAKFHRAIQNVGQIKSSANNSLIS